MEGGELGRSRTHLGAFAASAQSDRAGTSRTLERPNIGRSGGRLEGVAERGVQHVSKRVQQVLPRRGEAGKRNPGGGRVAHGGNAGDPARRGGGGSDEAAGDGPKARSRGAAAGGAGERGAGERRASSARRAGHGGGN